MGLERPILLTFSTTYIYADNADIVGGSEKVQNYADVIYGWSERINAFGWVLPGFILLDGY